MLEHIKSPLQHLLQNSLDHGLETPEKRRATGKSETGQITFSASQQGNSILIEVIDDGAGIDIAQVKKHAVKHQLITADEAGRFGEQETISLLFQSGFSTANTITTVSGRGVGLDIVRQAVESMHGMISVENRPGQGVKFSLSLPVSIATSLCLLVRVNHQIFALPTRYITHLMRIRPDQIQWEKARLRLIRAEGDPIPAVQLAHSLVMNGSFPEPSSKLGYQTVILVGSPEQPVGLLVDELCEVQEIVIKKLPMPLTYMPYIAGASILGTGAVILILNVTDLIRTVPQRV